MYQSILAATDGTELSGLAVEHAVKLAKLLGAGLTIVTVTEPPPAISSAELGWSVPVDLYEQFRKTDANRARKILEDASSVAAGLGWAAASKHVAEQLPYAGILAAARDTIADLIVMASHGHRGLDRLILGSQASKVLSLSKCPVLIVR